MKRNIFPHLALAFFTLLTSISCKNPYTDVVNHEKDYRIVPRPVKLTPASGRLVFKNEVLIVADAEAMAEAEYLRALLAELLPGTAVKLRATADNSPGTILLRILEDPDGAEESYKLHVNAEFAEITANTSKGIFYGIQSLRQLLALPGSMEEIPYASIPAVSMEDTPRFAYRGMHLDVARHFQPVSFVKKYIDLLAMHKLNTFHWHLTEDQGWRIEIKKYPKLTEIGAWRNGTVEGKLPWTNNDNVRYGGFYTQEEVREVVAYAAARHITIIPEIELPGHSSAAIASYPQLSCFPEEPTTPNRGVLSEKSKELQANGQVKLVYEEWGVTDDVYCAGKESTFEFITGVLDEVVELFPSAYIHIGGDECPKGNWERCAQCQNRMKEEGLSDAHELQSYFIERVEAYLNTKGRNIIGWDEILEGGLAPNATVMYWRSWDEHKAVITAASEGHDVIMTPNSHFYFDHYQADPDTEPDAICCLSSVEKVYHYDPVPEVITKMGLEDRIVGAQANVWTEYMKSLDYVEYMLLPRLSALSEVLWTPESKKDYENFVFRLEAMRELYDKHGYHYAKHVFETTSVKSE
ncbi:beta-N-acetylhexosaminidase [Robertkochia flava]|uniref:beta-N-acetylhexosaminidase n=1 Tax=Robertkochia flava TaxID=3447986 RepID=UPI001CCA3462|nr:beta-N-acetylhexosaminidase [Robertkochia marina]